ncbi:MAG: N-6 DNA methylase [Desulfovibrio sp.]|nr:N-6 DNA methylase [Desulfovibrio sp.]
MEQAQAFPTGLVQPEGSMRFALDSLLLACFAHREFEDQAPHALKNPVRERKLPPSLQAQSPSCHLAGELGAGAGSSLIGLLLLNPRLAGLGFELVPELVEAARENATRTGLASRLSFLQADCAELAKEQGQPYLDLVLANPPFWDEGMGKASTSPLAERARRGRGSLELFCQAARRLLVARGHSYFIYPAAQTARLVHALAKAGLGLRRLLFVRAWSGKPALRVLAEARKDCASDTLVLPDLVLYESSSQDGQDGQGDATPDYTPDATHFCPWLEARTPRRH